MMDSIRNIKQQYDSLVSAIEEADEYWIEQDQRKPHELMEKETQDTLLQALKTFSFVSYPKSNGKERNIDRLTGRACS